MNGDSPSPSPTGLCLHQMPPRARARRRLGSCEMPTALHAHRTASLLRSTACPFPGMGPKLPTWLGPRASERPGRVSLQLGDVDHAYPAHFRSADGAHAQLGDLTSRAVRSAVCSRRQRFGVNGARLALATTTTLTVTGARPCAWPNAPCVRRPQRAAPGSGRRSAEGGQQLADVLSIARSVRRRHDMITYSTLDSRSARTALASYVMHLRWCAK